MDPRLDPDLPPEVAALFEQPTDDERPGPRAWRRTWSWVVAAALIATLAWLTYTRDGWVPLLSGVDFGVHEFGHLMLIWAPRPIMALGGSAAQVLLPLGLAGYFWWRADRFATSLMLAWAGSSLNNVSVYIYDATRMMLLLWGDDGTGSNHDWRYLLGPEVLDALAATDAIAMIVRFFSALLFVAAFAVCAHGLLAPRLAERSDRERAAELARRRATLPVRPPRNPVARRAEAAAVEPLTPQDESQAPLG